MKIARLMTLNSVWALAICRGVSPANSPEPGEKPRTMSANSGMNRNQSSTPPALNTRCAQAACNASRGRPNVDRNAVAQVPRLEPKIMPMPVSSEIRPWLANTMTMAVVADELCTMAVNTAPMPMDSSGLRMFCIAARNGGHSRSGPVAMLMSSMPKKIRPRPITAMPHCLARTRRASTSVKKPAAISTSPYL